MAQRKLLAVGAHTADFGSSAGGETAKHIQSSTGEATFRRLMPKVVDSL